MPSVLHSVVFMDPLMLHIVVCFKNLGDKDEEMAQPQRALTTLPRGPGFSSQHPHQATDSQFPGFGRYDILF